MTTQPLIALSRMPLQRQPQAAQLFFFFLARFEVKAFHC